MNIVDVGFAAQQGDGSDDIWRLQEMPARQSQFRTRSDCHTKYAVTGYAAIAEGSEHIYGKVMSECWGHIHQKRG